MRGSAPNCGRFEDPMGAPRQGQASAVSAGEGMAGGAAITEDALLDGRVRLLQPARGHRAGTDAVLLAAAARARAGEHVIDVGAATGAVGLMIAARHPGVDLTLAERDPDLAALCRRNLELNRASGRVALADILDPGSRRHAGLEAE